MMGKRKITKVNKFNHLYKVILLPLILFKKNNNVLNAALSIYIV